MIVRLKEIADKITKGTTPHKEAFEGIDVNFIKSESLNYNGNIDTNSFNSIDIETHNTKLKRSILNENDILISIAGANLGKVGIVSNEMLPANTNQAVGIISINSNLARSKYIYYYLQQLKIRNFINNSVAQSAQPNINLSQLSNLKIELPEINTQDKIIKVLDTISEKIKLNTHTNNNLQELLLYKYNFYFKNKTANGKLKDIVIKKNKTTKKEKINQSLNYYPIDILPKKNIILQEGKNIKEAKSSLIEFDNNDILVGAMRVYFHRVCLANNSGITRNTTFILTPKDNEYLYYSLLTIYQDSFIDYASITSKGTTMPYAVWENVCSEFNIYIPNKEELKEFNLLCKSVIDKMNINQKENQKLEQLRDTLLPKLMNGEIDLDKVEI